MGPLGAAYRQQHLCIPGDRPLPRDLPIRPAAIHRNYHRLFPQHPLVYTEAVIKP